MLSHCQSTVQVTEGQTVRWEGSRCRPPPRCPGACSIRRADRPRIAMVSVCLRRSHVHGCPGEVRAGYDEPLGTKAWCGPGGPEDGSGPPRCRVSDPFQPVELRLGPAWTLTGRVADPNGSAIPAARVSLGMNPAPWNIGGGPDRSAGPVRDEGDSAGAEELRRTTSSATAAGYGQASTLRIFPKGSSGASVDLGTIRLPPANVPCPGWSWTPKERRPHGSRSSRTVGPSISPARAR